MPIAELRKRLLEGGRAAIDASNDPMIVLARAIDPDTRASRKEYEDNDRCADDEVLRRRSRRRCSRCTGRRAIRTRPSRCGISYGAVEGYPQDGKAGRADHDAWPACSSAPPARTRSSSRTAGSRRKSSLNLRQPFNFVTTNDIIGGNSGSPVINKAGEVVGLIFDGNIQSLGGDFGFDRPANRAVAVNVGALREALAKVYKADRIVKELGN